MPQRGPDHPPPLHPVRLAARVFAPCHLVCILVQVPATDPVMHAVLRAPKPREEAFGLIGIGAVVRDILDAVVDPACVVGCGIRCKADGDSDGRRTVIPIDPGQP